MQLIKKVLDVPIQKGYIIWETLEAKIHAALNTVDNKFNKIRNVKNNDNLEMKIEDAITVHILAEKKSYTYKIYQPRFVNGQLFCSGFMMGYGKMPSVIWDAKSRVNF